MQKLAKLRDERPLFWVYKGVVGVIRRECGLIRESKSTICYLRCQWLWYMVGIEVLKGFLVSGKS